jgi:hypothetical protein
MSRLPFPNLVEGLAGNSRLHPGMVEECLIGSNIFNFSWKPQLCVQLFSAF